MSSLVLPIIGSIVGVGAFVYFIIRPRLGNLQELRHYIMPIGFFIVVMAILLYFILRPSNTSSTVMVAGPYSLSTPTQVISMSNFPSTLAAGAFLENGQGTFQCFVYLDNLAKTGKHVKCGINTSTPNCSTGLYEPCECSTPADCTNCKHEGYQSVFNLYGAFTLEVMNVPDASRPNAVSAQLSLRTETTDSAQRKVHIETIPLPPIDQQKWVMITISKEGRRIDIYYNNALVSSSKTVNMISTVNINGTPASIGDSTLSGQIGGLGFLPNRLSVSEVSAMYATSTDTRGNPNIFTITPTSYTYSLASGSKSSIIQKLCLDGSCFSFPQIGLPDITSYENIFNLNPTKSILPLTSEYA
jgi:hypothetical protein